MNAHTQEHGDYRFAVGLLAGTCVGAGLMMWLAPRMAAELRQRVTDSAKNLGQRASGVRDEVVEAVVRGAHEVERQATAAISDRVAEFRKN